MVKCGIELLNPSSMLTSNVRIELLKESMDLTTQSAPKRTKHHTNCMPIGQQRSNLLWHTENSQRLTFRDWSRFIFADFWLFLGY